MDQFPHVVPVLRAKSPVRLLNLIALPVMQRLKPITPSDIQRVNEFLCVPAILSSAEGTELHSAVSCVNDSSRLILRMGATENEAGSKIFCLPIYELARVSNYDTDKARTDIVIRWTVEPSGAFNPIVHLLKPEPAPKGLSKIVSHTLDKIDTALLKGKTFLNRPQDFFPTIPSFSLVQTVWFGPGKFGT